MGVPAVAAKKQYETYYRSRGANVDKRNQYVTVGSKYRRKECSFFMLRDGQVGALAVVL